MALMILEEDIKKIWLQGFLKNILKDLEYVVLIFFEKIFSLKMCF